MTILRNLAIFLLLANGLLHMYPIATSAATQITVAMFVFGIMYLATGTRVALGSRAALHMGRILPIVGMALAAPGAIRGTMPFEPLTAVLLGIDMVLILLCSWLLSQHDSST